MPLNYNNSIPLYIQLKEQIEQKIISGDYKGKIPSEREIMDEFYVSRSTVRQALDELVNNNILIKKPGKGTFVALKPIKDWLGHLSSTSETIHKMGMKAGAELVDVSKITAPKHLQRDFQLKDTFHIKRIRYADNIPIGIETSYYPIHIGEKLSRFDLENVPLYDLIENQLEVRTKEAEQIIRAGTIYREDAKLLGVKENTTMLYVERTLLDVNNQFVEYESAAYRADMYSFKVNLARNL